MLSFRSVLFSILLMRMTTNGFQSSSLLGKYRQRSRLGLFHDDDSPEAAELLTLTKEDMSRLNEMKSRSKTIPILILDTMLPRQRISFQSDDPRFHTLIEHVLDPTNGSVVGMIGFNPHSGRPLNLGVTMEVTEDDVIITKSRNNGKPELTISGVGESRFEVVGEPWLDDSKSFYMANVDIIENRQEDLPDNLKKQAKEISGKIPTMVDDWLELVVLTRTTTPMDMTSRMAELGPIPKKSMKEQALWVAALVNPVKPLNVCAEIRPAMLSCRNDHDRMVLAAAALHSSIEHLNEKKKKNSF